MENMIAHRRQLEQLKGAYDTLHKYYVSRLDAAVTVQREIINIEKAVVIAQTVAQQTQDELKYHISELVTLALAAVFDDPYEFKVEFVNKRNKTEAEISFTKNGNDVDPMDSTGGGAVDVAAFALRVALFRLKQPRNRNTIILDEPGKFVSRDLQPKFSAMIKQLADNLGIQFIIVTHSDAIEDSADAVFHITKRSEKEGSIVTIN